MKFKYVDSHCHLADSRLDQSRDEFVRRAQGLGIDFFLQGGVGPEDWIRQERLQEIYPQIGTCFGLHPYWVADHPYSECDDAMDVLAMMLPEAYALGELGLDLRPHIMKDSYERQTDFFVQQLELAEVAAKPIVLHLVRAFDDAMKIFAMWGVPQSGGMVHSFNGSVKEAESYLKLGLHLSVGGPLVRPDNQKLQQAVKEIPLEKLLIESDSPDQPPPSHAGALNEPATIFEVATVVAEIKNMTATEVLDKTRENLENLLDLREENDGNDEFSF